MGKKSHRKRIPRGSELLWDSISGWIEKALGVAARRVTTEN